MLCRIYRWIMACALDNDEDLGVGTQRHLRSCPECRQYYHAQQQVSVALKQQVSQVTLPADHLLPKRILTSVSPGEPGRPQPRVFRFTTYRTLAACLLIALAVLIPLRYAHTQGGDPGSNLQDLTSMATVLQQLVPEQLMSADTLLVQDSLESEMINLSTDARKAVRFLVQCTPSHGGTGAGTSPE